LILLLAPPVAAQGQVVEGGEYNRYGPPRVDGAARPNFSNVGRGLSFSRENVIREDGSAGSRTRLVGSLPVADNVDLGIGLFSVVGETEKETMRRRTDPMRDARPRDSKVAAVGLQIRF
jgi:hypothetical protein